MKRKLILDGKEVCYELTRKKVRNINLRIRRDGSVAVSSPAKIPVEKIEEFMISKSSFILRAINESAQLLPDEEKRGIPESVFILGVKYPVSIVKGEENRAFFSGTSLNFTLTDPESSVLFEKAYDLFEKELCRSTVLEICDAIYEKVARKRVTYPSVSFRKMKSRWGSCNYYKGKITFSTHLAKVPIRCIEYVVAHEFTHLSVPDHSERFHAELSELIPDEKDIRREMKKYAALTY